MKRTMHRRSIALAALSAAVLGTGPAHAAGEVAAFAPDGRQLFVGSVVAEGTRSGDTCLFRNTSVTMLADEQVGSRLVLAPDSACRLVVTELSVSVPTAANLGDPTAFKRPKIDQTEPASSSASSVGGAGITRTVGSLVEAGAVEDAIALAFDAVDAAASTEKKDVQVTNEILNEAGIQEYRDFMAVTYIRNRKTQTVGTMEPYSGYCEGSYIDTYVFYGPYANDILSCFYKRTANGASKVGFVAGGTYRKSLAFVQIDYRTLTETFEATYSGVTKRVCGTGGALPSGWQQVCHWQIT